MIKKGLTIIMLIVILTVSIFPNLYVHSCFKNLCDSAKKELSVNLLNPSLSCSDVSFADHADSNENVGNKCCHTAVVMQPDTFLEHGVDHVYHNSDSLLSYFIPVILLYHILKPESKDIQQHSNLQHHLSELSGRELLSLNCILRI